MGAGTREIRILTNLAALDGVRRDGYTLSVRPYPVGRKSLADLLRLYRSMYRYDYVLLNTPPSDLFALALLKYLLPLNRCRLVSMDCVLPVPVGFSQRLRAALKGLLFRKVDLFIEYFRDTRGYQRYYRMKADRFVYVPFKVNRYERVLGTPVSDQGYVFCGGNTRRDFATLFAAARGLSVPFKVVTREDAFITRQGTQLIERDVPDNVEVVRHDGGDSFLDYIAGARLVALPIRKTNISASGIGVYLASMALGKCVIISEGVGVSDVLVDGQAYLVPPEDPAALRETIRLLYDDERLREQFAQKGRAYARGLQGETRLAESAMDVIIRDFEGGRVRDSGTADGAA